VKVNLKRGLRKLLDQEKLVHAQRGNPVCRFFQKMRGRGQKIALVWNYTCHVCFSYIQKEDHKGRLYEWAHLSIKGHTF